MKPNDKITVEITLAELAKIYAIMGCSNGGTYTSLYYKGRELFDCAALDWQVAFKSITNNGLIDYDKIEEAWLKHLFKKETDEQRKIRELKETIAKAQQQIKELENC